MSRIPVATELGRRDRFWPAVMASIAVHAAAIGLAVKASSLPTIELEQSPIHARLVRLGEQKPEQLLPQKDAPPPQPAPAEPAPPPPVQAPPAPPEPPSSPPAPPAPDAMPAPPVDAPRPAPRPGPARPPRPSPVKSPVNGGGLSAVDAALAKATKDVQRTRYGDPNGDPEGDSDEGSAGDKYDALVRRAIRSNYRVPSTISDRERQYLEAQVRIWVESDGTVSNWNIEKSSGNPVFDTALQRAIGDARLPPPPSEVRDAWRDRGRRLTFNLKND